jgi:sulfite exporter TauE/SafE
MTLSLLVSAVLMGLMGAGHCATMCGPITLALVTRQPERPRQPFASHFGRILVYAVLGAIVAATSAAATSFLRNEVLQTAWLLLPNLLLLFSALYLMGFQWAYAPVESAGRRVWRQLEGARSWASARGGTGGDLLRGALWGMLPCGMIYSALGLAVLAANPLDGALVMAAFGASTLPVLLALGMLSQSAVKRLQTRQTRRWLGGVLLLLVAWNFYLLPDRLHGVKFSFLC